MGTSTSRIGLFLLSLFFLVLGPLAVRGAASVVASDAAERIDLYIEQGLQAQGLSRQPLADDYQFARRVYLDVAGRIPTYRELRAFLSDDAPGKRARLIDALLDSEAYVSHFYNYWEDVLRVQSKGRRTVMVAYQDWIKESLRANLPYDQFVRRLLTSEGFVWDDAAVGYYVRDAGMPLDNMSNTMQVFAGVRMQCAQCHDHPFEDWTQKQYYHLAAFTYGTETETKMRDVEAYQSFQKAVREAARNRNLANGEKPGAGLNKLFDGTQRRALRELFLPFRQEVRTTGRALHLPEDYKYDNAKPNQKMKPETPFGDAVKLGRKDDPRESFASWLTSPENPRFSQVIANRLWKKVFGLGLVEPVDDWSEDTVASHPELMAFLGELVEVYGYDTKQYLRTLLNTRSYQSQVAERQWAPGEPRYFEGPQLRRMTAEQIWDSILTLSVPDVDSRIQGDPQTFALRERALEMENQVKAVQSLEEGQIYAVVMHLGKVEEAFLAKEKELKQQMNAAANEQEKKALRRSLNQLRREKNEGLETLVSKVAQRNGYKPLLASGSGAEGEDASMMEGDAAAKRSKGNRRPRDTRFLVRASAVVSPAPDGHFLREFGESDREIIESSNVEASVPQALSLLNGQPARLVLNPQSTLSRALEEAESPQQRESILFLSFFGRSPTAEERQLLRQQMERIGEREGLRRSIVALLNTQEFRFIQ